MKTSIEDKETVFALMIETVNFKRKYDRACV